MARRNLPQAGPEHDQRAEKRHRNRADPAQVYALPQEKRRADRHHDRVQVADRRHLGERDARHGEEPEHHRQRMQRAAPGDQRQRGARNAGTQRPQKRRRQDEKAEGKADEGAFGGRKGGAQMPDGRVHGHETQPRDEHPGDALKRAVGIRDRHAPT